MKLKNMNTQIEKPKPFYKNKRLNRLANRNGGRLFGEETMLEMLADGSLFDYWDIPDTEIFGEEKEEI